MGQTRMGQTRMGQTRMAALTREELNELAAGGALLVIPIGATEQHGEHLAVGTDHVAADVVAQRAAAQIAQSGEATPVVAAPVLAFGHSPHHVPFGGTLSLTPATFQQVLVELGCTAIASGFRRVFFLNGHGGNVDIASISAREVTRLTSVPAGAGSYWSIAADALATTDAAERGHVPGHAGHFETSIALALDSAAASAHRPARPEGPPPAVTSKSPFTAALPWFWQEIDGWSDEAVNATAEAGERYLAAIVDAVAAALVEFIGQTEPPDGWSP